MEANYFTILYWFGHTSTWIRHGCTRVPHPEPPSHLPPHTIPLGHPSAPALSILYHASKLDWRFVSHSCFLIFHMLFLFSGFPLYHWFHFFLSFHFIVLCLHSIVFSRFLFLCHSLLQSNLFLNTCDPWLFTHVKNCLEALSYNWGTLPGGLHCRQAVDRWLFPWVSLGPLSGVVYFIQGRSYQYIS